MHDTSWLLERAGERFDMPEPAVERLVRRRDRKLRNRRLATGAVALGISVVGVGVAVAVLRTRGPTVPASGGAPSWTEAGGGWTAFVLPSVAIWAAVAALGLALLALGRLAARPVPPPGPSEAPPPASTEAWRNTPTVTPPAREKGNARKGVAMRTHAESFPARHTARSVWVTVGALVLLALAIVTGIAIGRATVEEPAPPPEPLGLASTEMVQAVDAQLAALNAADQTALAGMFAEEAVFTDMIAGIETVGADEIAAFYLEDTAPGYWELERTSEVVQMGSWAAHGFTYFQGASMAVYLFDDDLRIVHQWIMGPSEP